MFIKTILSSSKKINRKFTLQLYNNLITIFRHILFIVQTNCTYHKDLFTYIFQQLHHYNIPLLKVAIQKWHAIYLEVKLLGLIPSKIPKTVAGKAQILLHTISICCDFKRRIRPSEKGHTRGCTESGCTR